MSPLPARWYAALTCCSADEPTSALDRQSGRDVVELLRRLARHQGCAVVMVTHDNRIWMSLTGCSTWKTAG